MEVLEGAEFVRLRSVEHGTYLHAAEDGRGVLLDARPRSHHAAWAVELLRSGGARGTIYVLLRGAYGRYLGAPEPSWALLDLPCRRAAAQRDRDEPEARAIMWRAVGTGGGANVVLLHDAHGRFLHANWRWLPIPCRPAVTVVDGGCLGPTIQWAVEVIPWTYARPELPLECDSEWGELFDWACPPLAPLRRRLWRAFQQREIRWVRADDLGNFREKDWISFRYSGRSVPVLRSKLAHFTQEFYRLTLCVRAGHHGQLTPLVTDLPRSRERLDIVLIMGPGADGGVADRLIFPDLDKETAAPAKEDATAIL